MIARQMAKQEGTGGLTIPVRLPVQELPHAFQDLAAFVFERCFEQSHVVLATLIDPSRESINDFPDACR
jgi:hypothetical protein